MFLIMESYHPIKECDGLFFIVLYYVRWYYEEWVRIGMDPSGGYWSSGIFAWCPDHKTSRIAS